MNHLPNPPEPSPGRALSRHYPALVLTGLVLLSLVLSLVDLGHGSDEARFHQGGDTEEYLSLAENLDHGEGYVISHGDTFQSSAPTSYRTPGYPLAILALRQLVEPEILVFGIVVYQNLLLAFLPLLLYSITKTLTARSSWALGAAALTVLFFPFRYLADVVSPDFLGLFLLLAAVAVLYSQIERQSVSKLLCFSLFLGLAVMVKQNLATVLGLLIYPLPRMLRLRQLAVAALFPALFLSVWVGRNLVVQHAFPIFATNGGFNFFVGSHPDFRVDASNLTDFRLAMRDLIRQGLTEVEADRELYRRGWENVRRSGLATTFGRVLSKAHVMLADYFPPVRNEVLFLVLPFALLLRRRTFVVAFLIAYQVVLLLLHPGFEFGLWDWYMGFNLDVTALHAIGLMGLVLALRTRDRSLELLVAGYALILLPGLVYIPLDRMTIVADAFLLIAYVLTPVLLLEPRFHPVGAGSIQPEPDTGAGDAPPSTPAGAPIAPGRGPAG